jgi:DNA-binding MarR family transcriptional regulator
LQASTGTPGLKERFARDLKVGKHFKIEADQQVASVFVPISRTGSFKQLQGLEWRKDLLMSWLFQTCIRLQTSLDRRFLRFGMTVQEASVLVRCVEARSITPGQLAVWIGRDKGMITRFIDHLEDSRLIVRHVNPRDHRFSILKPTAKGKQTARNLASLFDEIRKELFAGVLETEVGELSRMMARLHKNAVDIGSAEKCEAVRQCKRIGRDVAKARVPQSGYALLPADILAPFTRWGRGQRASN